MDNALLLASIMGPALLVFGLSILFYAKAWGEVMKKWTKDHYSLIPFMLMTLILGLISVHMYNVWEWNLWLIVTIVGWGMIVKGAFYFLLPGSWFTGIMKWANKSGLIYVGGLVATVVGAIFSYHAYLV